MPSTLISHHPVPPSEPLAAALTIYCNDSNLQGKTSATKQKNFPPLKAGDVKQHSQVGKKLFGMNTSVIIPVLEEQKDLGLTMKVRLTVES